MGDIIKVEKFMILHIQQYGKNALMRKMLKEKIIITVKR